MDGFVPQRGKQGPWRQRQRKVTETADMQQIGVQPVGQLRAGYDVRESQIIRCRVELR